jgi:hypothetical protein
MATQQDLLIDFLEAHQRMQNIDDIRFLSQTRLVLRVNNLEIKKDITTVINQYGFLFF